MFQTPQYPNSFSLARCPLPHLHCSRQCFSLKSVHIECAAPMDQRVLLVCAATLARPRVEPQRYGFLPRDGSNSTCDQGKDDAERFDAGRLSASGRLAQLLPNDRYQRRTGLQRYGIRCERDWLAWTRPLKVFFIICVAPVELGKNWSFAWNSCAPGWQCSFLLCFNSLHKTLFCIWMIASDEMDCKLHS